MNNHLYVLENLQIVKTRKNEEGIFYYEELCDGNDL